MKERERERRESAKISECSYIGICKESKGKVQCWYLVGRKLGFFELDVKLVLHY
jgi:hypothetical protein